MNGLPDPRRSRAVLIGVGNYRKLSSLPAVHNNLLALGEVLRARRFWGLPADNCTVVESPETAAEMLDPVVDAANAATDTLLLYYAGHGLVDRRSELHLALVGSDPQRMYTSVPYDNIRDVLLDSRAARRLVILDCCYSGRALGQMADFASSMVEEISAEGTYILAATAENKTALAPPGRAYTAFTGELLEVIQNGIRGCGPLLDMDSIYRNLLAGMREKGLPLPQKRDRNTAGLLALVRNQAFNQQLDAPRSVSRGDLTQVSTTDTAPSPSTSRSQAAKIGSRPGRERSALIREWARQHGYKVTENGRIPANIVAEYEAVHAGAAVGVPGPGQRERNAAIRQWARLQGYEVSESGRIPANIVAEYEAIVRR